MKKFLVLVSVGIFGIINNASANSPKLLGEYNDWSAYYYEDGKNLVCYIASTPIKDEGSYNKRGNIYVVITHRPAEKSFDVVNFVAGYTYSKDADVTVKIGKTVIDRMFVDKDKAWAVSEKVDKELVDAMKKGEKMYVSGTSSKGTATKDTYSLSGFTAAYKAISSKCPKK
jgi:invasion protein IalB